MPRKLAMNLPPTPRVRQRANVTSSASCRPRSAERLHRPYARQRPGTAFGDGVRIGNFVETKAATIEAGAKVNHLSYVGDAHVGANANLGAGTITCNYDGFFKHKTTIGEGAFVGTNSSLVAPVKIGKGAYRLIFEEDLARLMKERGAKWSAVRPNPQAGRYGGEPEIKAHEARQEAQGHPGGEPTFYADVEYRDITSEGLLRASSFKELSRK